MRKLGLAILLINIVLLDVYVLYGLLVKKGNLVGDSQTASDAENIFQADNKQVNCTEECLAYIDSKLGKSDDEVRHLPTPTQQVVIKEVSVPASTKIKNVSYLPIPGSGSRD